MLIPCIYYYFRFQCMSYVVKECVSAKGAHFYSILYMDCVVNQKQFLLSCLLWKSNILGLWNNMLDDTLDADDETNERSYLASSYLFSLRIYVQFLLRIGFN